MSQKHRIGEASVEVEVPAGLQELAMRHGVNLKHLHRHKVMNVASYLDVNIDRLGGQGLRPSDLRDHPDIMKGFARNTRAFVPVDPDIFKRALVETMLCLKEQAMRVFEETPTFEKDGQTWTTLWTVAGEEEAMGKEDPANEKPRRELKLFYSTSRPFVGDHPQVDPRF